MTGEVKDTNRTEYAITGLRELIDYMELVKDKNGVYLREKSDEMVEGSLFVGYIEVTDPMNDDVKIHSMSNRNEQSLNVTILNGSLPRE